MKPYHLVAALCLTLFIGSAASGWSTEPADPVKAAYSALGNDAIVTRIENGTVTLQSLGDSSKEYQLAANYVENARIGDRVKIDGNGIRKIDQPSATAPGNNVKKEPQSVEQPAATLDQNPKPGSQP